MNDRLNRLRGIQEQRGLDLLLITSPKMVYYFTGFYTEPHERFLALVCERGEEPFLFVPALDRQKAEQASAVTRIYAHGDAEQPFALLKTRLRGHPSTLGIQALHLNVGTYRAILEALDGVPGGALGIDDELNRLRVVKDVAEIAKIRRAIVCIEDVFRDTLPFVKPGVTELDLVAELEYRMKKQGADGPSFDTMALTGAKTGLPHGVPGANRVQEGDFLLFDAGVFVEGYASDLTRTFAVGEIGAKKRDIYDTVLRANRAAIAAAKPGAAFGDVDRAAREVIEAAGYGEWFVTRTGHGFGLEIHEYPSVHGLNRDPAGEGMVFTIEPGIYHPALGGVRIEDDVRITREGADVMTTFPKDLTVIGI